MQSESEAMTHTHKHPKPVLPACIRIEKTAKKQGYPTSPVAKRPNLMTRLKLSVFECLCVYIRKIGRHRDIFICYEHNVNMRILCMLEFRY